MTPVALRSLLRWMHIAAGLLIGAYVYSPLNEIAAMRDALMYVVLPFLALSGLVMWQQGPIRRFLTRRRPGD